MNEDPWRYATHEGTEKPQHEMTGKLTLSERLDVFDEMLHFVNGQKKPSPAVAEHPAEYGSDRK